MRWYVNDISLQGQFRDINHFIEFMDCLMEYRNRHTALKSAMFLTRSIADQPVTAGLTMRQALQTSKNADIRRAVLFWLDRKGPFVEDDRLDDPEDYFEYGGIDVTNKGLGEATRRAKAKFSSLTFSIPGGNSDFAIPELTVDHGILEDRLGQYRIQNIWKLEVLSQLALKTLPPPKNWPDLMIIARENFRYLQIPNAVYENPILAREPFDAPIAERTFALFKCLNDYMIGRDDNGAEGPHAREVIDEFFTGDRALFSGESAGNQEEFKSQMTFTDPSDSQKEIFAHWHGKISHRFFRLHFEWPVPAKQKVLKVLYLGPKITKK